MTAWSRANVFFIIRIMRVSITSSIVISIIQRYKFFMKLKIVGRVNARDRYCRIYRPSWVTQRQLEHCYHSFNDLPGNFAFTIRGLCRDSGSTSHYIPFRTDTRRGPRFPLRARLARYDSRAFCASRIPQISSAVHELIFRVFSFAIRSIHVVDIPILSIFLVVAIKRKSPARSRVSITSHRSPSERDIGDQREIATISTILTG